MAVKSAASTPEGIPAPVAQFTGTPTSGAAPLTVNFSNASAGSITSYAWTFGDGGTSTAASPSHVYTAVGTYTVNLTVTGPGGSNTRTRSDYVMVTTGVAPFVPDLNQHGLTGSWYEPATDGQGAEIEVFPDLVAPGTGSVQVSWFTFDTVAGGADRQRWYTLSGNVVSGQPNAALTIYQNTGGNFNAPPITNGVPVGTATLSFDTCTSGQLSYHFDDGRAGEIPLTRITQNVTCSTTSARPTNADFTFSGNWYNAVTSGQGFVVEVNLLNGAVFVTWYTYAPGGSGAGAAGQRWYTASGAFAAGSRSIPVDIRATTGGAFDAPTVPPPTSPIVGSGTLAFQSCSTATFSYNFSGGSSSGTSGTIALSRIGPVPAGCAY
jgi:PKD repeat protein